MAPEPGGLKIGSGISRRRFMRAVGAGAGAAAFVPAVVRAQAPGKPAEPSSTITTPPREWGPAAPRAGRRGDRARRLGGLDHHAAPRAVPTAPTRGAAW